MWLFYVPHVPVIPSSQLCSTSTATQTVQYISSSQVTGHQCRQASGSYDYELSIQAKQGQKIEVSLVNLNVLRPEDPVSPADLGYYLESDSDKVTPVSTSADVETVIGVSESSGINVFLTSDTQINYLLGFKGKNLFSLHNNFKFRNVCLICSNIKIKL